MKKNVIKTLLIFLILIGGLINAYSGEFDSAMDYIKKTSKLWGVSKVILNENNRITLVDRKKQGHGYALGLMNKNHEWIDEITLKPNESCLLTDGRHAFITYKLISIRNSNIVIEVIDKFDARSFGDDIKEEMETVTIKPYKDNE